MKKATFKKKVALVYVVGDDYFLLKKSFTFEGSMILSTNVYAPDFSDFTIFIALVNLFDPVCNDATDFFAMIQCIIDIFTKVKISNYLISL